MAKADLGEKQTCPECSAKFYDLKKRPAACPKCGHSFTPEDESVKLKRAKEKEREVPEDEEVDEDEEKKVETDDVEDEEDPDVKEVDVEADAIEIAEDEEDDTPGAKPAFADQDIEADVVDDESGISIVEDEAELVDDDDIEIDDDPEPETPI